MPSLGKQGQGDNNLGSSTGVLTTIGSAVLNKHGHYVPLRWLITAVSSLVILVLVGTVVCSFWCALVLPVKGYICAISVQLRFEVAVLKKDRESQSQIRPKNRTSRTPQMMFGLSF